MTSSLETSLVGHSPLEWARDFLNMLGAPVTPENLQVIYSWEYAESGGGGGIYNPLNTTQSGYPGETNYNSSGVKNYTSYMDGLAASCEVMHDKAYEGILAALMVGDSVPNTVAAITSSIWGTHSLPLRELPPVSLEVEMQFVVSPQKATLKGRTAAAKWNPTYPNQVILENGARVKGNKPIGIGTDRYYVTIPVPSGNKCVGIARNNAGTGFVAFDDNENTYDFFWTVP